MDYTNFIPSFSHRHIPTDNMSIDADEYWTPKVLQTRLKLWDLHNKLNEHSAPTHIMKRINLLLDTVGVWSIEQIHIHQTAWTLTNALYRRRNLVTNSDWEPIDSVNIPLGMNYDVWLKEGIMLVLPSEKTIGWLNQLAYLYCVSNKETV